jgi:predicted peroxiredoxin
VHAREDTALAVEPIKCSKPARTVAGRVIMRASRAGSREVAMGSLLVHITHGPEAPTRAALGFLVARAAVDEGHAVTLFLAGDAVALLRDATLDALSGVGTGSLRESFDALTAGGARFYVSGMSSKARGVGDADIAGKPAEFAQPARLVQLTFEADRVLTY